MHMPRDVVPSLVAEIGPEGKVGPLASSSPSPSPGPAASRAPGPRPLPREALIGIIVGAVVVLLLSSALACVLVRRARRCRETRQWIIKNSISRPRAPIKSILLRPGEAPGAAPLGGPAVPATAAVARAPLAPNYARRSGGAPTPARPSIRTDTEVVW